jgi:glycosyltransferase involved in cell wall biosynthesis
MECPVIASSNSSLPEVCGEAAILIDGSDVSDISIAMDRVLMESGLREILSHQGRRQAARFSYGKFTEQVLQTCLSS